MALETGNNTQNLNATWPLDIDPVSLGAAHLRLIKTALKNQFLGVFFNRQAIKDWYTANSPTFLDGAMAVVESRWYIISSISAGANTTEGLDFFILASTWRAIAVSRPKQLGQINSQNTQGIAIINSTQRRRPLVRYVHVLSGTSFDVAAANAAFPNSAPVQNDICIQLIAGSPSYSFIKKYTGSWQDVDIELFNVGAAFGAFSAQMLSAVSLDSDRVRTSVQETIGDVNMHVVKPDGFGPDELAVWYGPKAGLIGLNGEISYNSLLEANAIYYLKTNGISNAGGEAPPVDPPPTDATVLSNLGTLATAYSAQTSRYNNQIAAASITLSFNTSGQFVISGFLDITELPQSGPYLSATAAGIGDQFEVKFDAPAGSGLTGTLGTWQAITQTRSVTVSVSSNEGTSDSIAHNIIVSVRKIVTPATVETKTVTLTATAFSYPGQEP